MPDPAQIPLSSRLRAVLDAVPALVVVFRGADLVVEYANLRHRELLGGPDLVGDTAAEVLGDIAHDPLMAGYLHDLRCVLETGETVSGWEAEAHFPGAPGTTYWDYVMIPLRSAADMPPDAVVLHATDVTRLVETRRAAAVAEHRFTTLFEANVIGVSISDQQTLLEANDAFLEMVGRTRAELEAGLDWTAITDPTTLRADEQALVELRSTGAAHPYHKVYVRPDGTRVPVLISGSRLSEDPLRILATAYDLTGRQAAEREVATLLARTTRLQEVTAGFSATNSPEDIARAVVHHALEALSASAGAIVRRTPDPRLAHAVGVGRSLVEQWRAFPATLPAPLREAARDGRVVEVVGAAEVERVAADLVPAGSLVAVPLEVAGRVVGALLLASREPRPLAAEDREFLLLLARQAATALDRSELFENRAYVARKLQEGLLPHRLAEAPGLETAVVYESISGGGEVGGDFYDFLETGRESWLAVVGDVVGKGTDAAVVTGLARHTLRAIARMEDEPAQVLCFLNGALRRHTGPRAFCTVGCALLERHPAGGFSARVASGGHPFPIVVRGDGTLEEVEILGTMLGVADDPDLDRTDVHLAAGDALVVYTDGVTDARAAGGERFGEARLLDALRGAAGRPAAEVAGAVDAAVRAHHTGTPADDRAVLVLRATA